MSENAITAEGLEELRTELEELEGPGREAIAAQIKTAREWGDLKENAEYHAAKEAQAHLETKILKLRERMLTAKVVETASGDVVDYGSTVEPYSTTPPVAVSTTVAVTTFSRTRRIFVSRCACASLAAWYSAFSLRSPQPRAVLICSAILLRSSVSRRSSSAWSASRPSAVM